MLDVVGVSGDQEFKTITVDSKYDEACGAVENAAAAQIKLFTESSRKYTPETAPDTVGLM